MSCPCGSRQDFADCCSLIHRGERTPTRAEELMRARYSAYVKGDIDFILSSHDPKTREETDRESLEAWSKESEWLGLEIVSKDQGEPDDETGVVEFIARFKNNDQEHAHHERALFNKRQGQWFFSDGTMVIKPVKREGEKIGRNDPCQCGSGKKYKKCCLLNV